MESKIIDFFTEVISQIGKHKPINIKIGFNNKKVAELNLTKEEIEVEIRRILKKKSN